MTAPLDLYCAVDILDGGAVRLTKGDFGVRTDHGDPVELALRYVRSGARLLHVVDLDAARSGKPMNRAAVLRIVEKSGVPVQVGGGARTVADVTALLDNGVARVVISTLAVEDPVLVNELAERYPGRLALGLDHRPRSSPDAGTLQDGTLKDGTLQDGTLQDGTLQDTAQVVAVRGWEQSAELSVETVLDRFREAPLGAVVATSIERDGTLSGPDTSGVTRILAASDHPVIASGGVRSVADLAELARVSIAQPDSAIRRLAGAVVGRALADGSLDVQEAIAACER